MAIRVILLYVSLNLEHSKVNCTLKKIAKFVVVVVETVCGRFKKEEKKICRKIEKKCINRRYGRNNNKFRSVIAHGCDYVFSL